MQQGQLLATGLIYTRQKYIVLDETQKFTKTDRELLTIIDPDPGASLTPLRLDDPNLRSTVYMKTHYFFHKIKNIQF